MRRRLYSSLSYVTVLLGLLLAGLPGSTWGQTGNLPPHWQWQNPLPQGFDLNALHVFNDSTALAVGNAGTVVKTQNYGRTWRVSTAGTSANLTAVSFATDLVGWTGQEYEPAAVRKTTDGGLTWTVQPLGIPAVVVIRHIQFFSANEGYVLYYAGLSGSTELRYTADGGQTWTLRSRLISNDPGQMQFVTPTIGYLTGGEFRSSVQKTTDGGLTWQRISPTPTVDYAALSFVSATHGWVCRIGSPSVYRTTDGGQTWQAQTQAPSNGCTNIRFADALRGVATTAGGSVVSTSDGGQTWTYGPVSPADRPVLHLASTGGGWLTGSKGRWLRTVDYGASWLAADSVPAGTVGYAQFPDPTHGWVTKSWSTLARTADRGRSWTTIDLKTRIPANTIDWGYGAGQVQGSHFVDRDTGFVAVMDYGDSNQITAVPRLFSLATTDAGQTWTVHQQPALNISRQQVPLPLVYDLRFQSARRGLVAGARGLLRRTTDGGQTWTTPTAPAPWLSLRRTFTQIVWVDAQTVYVAGDSLTLLKSTDGGASFQYVPSLAAFKASLPSPRTWSGFRLAFPSPQVGLVSFINEMLRTTDGGQTWAFVSLPADQSVVLNQVAAFSFATPSLGWAISQDNVAETTDGGLTWTRVAIFSPYSRILSTATRIDRYNGWASANSGGSTASNSGNLLHYSEKFLTTDALAQASACVGDFLDVAFQREGSFDASEQTVRVELSNARGRFRPGETRLLGQGTTSPLRVSLPATLPTGTRYRIRVVRDDFSVLGADNGQDLTINALATASISPAGPALSVCQGSSVTLTAPAGLAQYLWSTGATTRSISVSTTGTYTVQGASATGCLGPPSAAVTVSVLPLPAPPVVVQALPGGPLTVSSPLAGATYQWLLGGTAIPGATGPSYPASGGAPPVAGSYTVIATLAGCASPPSAPLAVVLATLTSAAQALHLYPNPARTTLWLERPAGAAAATVQLLDVTGRVVWHGTAGAGTYALPVQQVPAGLYLVHLQTPTGPPQVARVVVEH